MKEKLVVIDVFVERNKCFFLIVLYERFLFKKSLFGDYNIIRKRFRLNDKEGDFFLVVGVFIRYVRIFFFWVRGLTD